MVLMLLIFIIFTFLLFKLLTILEVVIHDPLYKWNLSPLEALKRQERKDNENVNNDKNDKNNIINSKNDSIMLDIAKRENKKMKNFPKDKNDNIDKVDDDIHGENHGFGREAAERTLLRIKNKLLGFEDATSGVLGIEGQVELLISEARNIDNLCKLFCGWSPWL